MALFDDILNEALTAPGLLEQIPEREAQRVEAEHRLDELLGLEPFGALPDISERAIQLIVAFEVTSEATYERRYRRPIWPKGQSGITIGIGYDVGYVTAAILEQDWRRNTSIENIAVLKDGCGRIGLAAKVLLDRVQLVNIPFQNAMAVFRNITLEHTIAKTIRYLPNSTELPSDCLGALVSLVYNRGASFLLSGERYQEMRGIYEEIKTRNFNNVPAKIRAMKRLWINNPDMAGLVKRRELEAVLFEEGLHGR